MKIKIILKGGLKSCCSTYPSEVVEETINEWMNDICDVEVVDVENKEWSPDELAALAIKYFEEYAYPLVYVDDLLVTIGYLPTREDMLALLCQEKKKGITFEDIMIAVKNLDFEKDERRD